MVTIYTKSPGAVKEFFIFFSAGFIIINPIINPDEKIG